MATRSHSSQQQLAALRADPFSGDAASCGAPGLPAPGDGFDRWIGWWHALPGAARESQEVGALFAHGVGRGVSGESRDERWAAAAALLPDGTRVAAMEEGVRRCLLEEALRGVAGDTAAMQRIRSRLWELAWSRVELRAGGGLPGRVWRPPIVLGGAAGSGRSGLACALASALGATWDERGGCALAGVPHRLSAGSPPGLELASLVLGHAARLMPEARKRARRGAIEDAGVALVIDDLSPGHATALLALSGWICGGVTQRVGSSRPRTSVCRPVLVVTDLDALAPQLPARLSTALSAGFVELPPLAQRLADPAAWAVERLGALHAGAELPDGAEALLRRVVRRREPPAEFAEMEALVAALAAGTPTAVLASAPGRDSGAARTIGSTPLAASDSTRGEDASPVSTRVPAPSVPPAIERGELHMEELREWYARHVRALSHSDSDAARRLGINRGTLARYLGH